MRPFGDILRLERAEALDRPATAVRAVVQRVLRNRTLKDALHGVWQSNRCPHLSAPLHQGQLFTIDGEVCVTFPWHASVFRVHDGGVVHGLATAPVPGFESRVEGGVLQVRVRTLPGIEAS